MDTKRKVFHRSDGLDFEEEACDGPIELLIVLGPNGNMKWTCTPNTHSLRHREINYDCQILELRKLDQGVGQCRYDLAHSEYHGYKTVMYES
jgi:hypothetical protein